MVDTTSYVKISPEDLGRRVDVAYNKLIESMPTWRDISWKAFYEFNETSKQQKRFFKKPPLSLEEFKAVAREDKKRLMKKKSALWFYCRSHPADSDGSPSYFYRLTGTYDRLKKLAGVGNNEFIFLCYSDLSDLLSLEKLSAKPYVSDVTDCKFLF